MVVSKTKPKHAMSMITFVRQDKILALLDGGIESIKLKEESNRRSIGVERRVRIERKNSGKKKKKGEMLTATSRTTFSLLNCKVPSSSPSLVRSLPPSSVSFSRAFNPLSLKSLTRHYGIGSVKSKTGNSRSAGFRVHCYAPPLTHHNLQWISAVSSLILILARGTAVPKSFIVPLFALQAPAGVVAWIKGRYGVWSAFLALLVRLFFHIPGELELPFIALLLVIVAPQEAMRLRDTKEGAFISLLITVYLAFQHFSRTSLQKSFDQGSIVASLTVICITVVSLLLLI